MRVLLKEGADEATAATILVLPQLIETTLETLSGEAVSDGGIVAEAEYEVIADAINTGARSRDAQSISPKRLLKEVEWIARAISPYEIGSKIGLRVTASGCALDDSLAKRTNRAEGLAEGDTIAVGPVSPKKFLNARGWVIAIEGDRVEVELEAGDRDRIQRTDGKEVPKRTTFPLSCIEKVV